ncbi:MAG: hypothetical protein NTX32_07900 [Candidatus Firestonebacteria bacterium]|nr:hypothetical protein [Candidatus Firestonebacteria bacterium]
MSNLPEVTIGLVAVSKDCFSLELSKRRRDAVFREAEHCQSLQEFWLKQI